MWGTIADVAFTIAQRLWESAAKLGPHIRTSFLISITTTLFLVFFFTTWNMFSEGDIRTGWRDTEVFFFRSNGSLLRAMEQNHVQLYLAREERAQKVILTLMQRSLHLHPNVARVRLALIHDGTDGLNPISALRYDITATVTAPGFGPGPVETNVPLLTASDFIEAMMAKKCVYLRTNSLTNTAFKSVMVSGNSASFLACPVVAPEGQITGFTTEEWVAINGLPADSEIPAIENEALKINADIGVALEAANS